LIDRPASFRRTIAAVILTLFIVCPGITRGNSAPPFRDGSLAVEPNGVRDVIIKRETLTLDMRPLADAKPVLVEALYLLDCKKAIDKVDLVFIAGSETTSAFEVTLDDQKVATSRRPVKDLEKDLPVQWRPPHTTPGINSESVQYHTATPSFLWSFQLSLTPGEHRLRVRYEAVAASYRGKSPAIYWQLAYVLAPAREWGEFGGLDVTVYLPERWHAASQPLLTREGDTLVGRFDSLPADSLALTVQYPPPVGETKTGGLDLVSVTLVGGLVVCLLTGVLLGLWLGRGGYSSSFRALPFAIGSGLLWTIALIVALCVTFAAPADASPEIAAIPTSQRAAHGASLLAYEFTVVVLIVLCLVSLVAIPAGLVITQFTAWLTRRLTARPAAPASVPRE
jgi:hypothetical protein